ncbi:cellulose biosynthesis protein BcsC [Marinobacterium sp. 3-1745]|uniref:Cellulose biosynthesis protein BcsC n=1 Tax=Marinobacterium marinum TaxID=2756129 RepID=A0A7W2A9J5_9GAMM|nr:cellulose biosynthesis protein BcsC [Marinobacterium marinum]
MLHTGGVWAQSEHTRQQQTDWLMDQLHAGQALYRDDLVQSALRRLELLAPLHPDVLFAGVEFHLEQGNQARAEELLNSWPREDQSFKHRQAEALLHVYTDGEQQLQQARLLAASGQVEQAMALYRTLWQDQPPGLKLGVEHWRTLGRLDEQRPAAIEGLQQMDRRYPGNPEVRLGLIKLLLAEERAEEALLLLGELAKNPQAVNRAAEVEYNYLIDLPVSDDAAQLWERFLTRYVGTSYHQGADREWQNQRTLLGDPAWRAGEKGKALVAAERYRQAHAPLKAALKTYPDDPGLLGALGQVQVNLQQYGAAVRTLTRAEKLEQDGSFISKWHDLRIYAQSLEWLQRGHQALADGQYAQAQRAYRKVMQIRPDDVDGPLGMAETALAEGDDATALKWFGKARRINPENGKLVYTLVGYYRTRSLEQAEAVLDSLSPAARKRYADLVVSVQQERLMRDVEAALVRRDTATAMQLLQEATESAPPSPWLSYRLADLLVAEGKVGDADEVFQTLLEHQGQDPEARYAHGLYLASLDRDDASLATLAAIESSRWTPGMEELALRVEGRKRRQAASLLREQGDMVAARANLSRSNSPEDHLLLADWLREDGAYAEAIERYQQLTTEESVSLDARLGLVESYLRTGDHAFAQVRLDSITLEGASVNQQRRYIYLLTELGQTDHAARLIADLVEAQPSDPLVLRDAAQLQSDPEQALSLYAQGLASLGLMTSADAGDGESLTRATRSRVEDDWLAASLKRGAAETYQHLNPSIQLQHDTGWRTDNSPSGVNDLSLQTTLLRLEVPAGNGRAWLQAEQVRLDSDIPESRDFFGACNAVLDGCQFDGLDTSGTGVAIGWSGDRWSWDLGHSPFGFEVDNWLGGVSYDSSLGEWGYTLTLSRRPMSNSLVSYAGAVDPVTGLSWGGVTATGVTLGLSHDQGEANGVWASLGAHQLEGERVEDNIRLTAMGGYYHRMINELDEQLRVGGSVMFMHFDKELSENTLGQGAYYSPQAYLSFGLPVSYARRSQDWSVALDASLGWSYSRTDGHAYYPGHESLIANSGWVPDPYAGWGSDADSSTGLGVRMSARGEYRLDSHWVLGGGISWQASNDYAPGSASVYLRYLFNPWQGKLDLPVGPLEPYAEWR